MLILSDKDIPKYKVYDILFRKGVLIMPCDTIYGFVGTVPETAQRINSIKRRKPDKEYLQLILPQWFCEYGSRPIDHSLLSLCPGKITFVVQNKAGKKSAVRFPEAVLLKFLLHKLGKPLYSTSVNRSGEEILFRSEKIIQTFGSEVDAFIDAGDLLGQKPSTIVDITSRPYRILRPGACSIPRKFLME